MSRCLSALLGAGLILIISACVTSVPLVDSTTPTPPSLAPTLPPPLPDGTTPVPIPDPTRNADHATTTAPPGRPTSPATKANNRPSQNDLRRALLSAADLPGFATISDRGGTAAGSSGCAALDTDFSAGASAVAEVLLSRGDAGPFIRERLRQLTVSSATAALTRIRSASTSCSTFTGTDPTFGEVNFTVTALGTPVYGNATVAIRLTMTVKALPSVQSYQNLVAIRTDATLILLSHSSVITIDDGLTSTAAHKAYVKVQAAW